MAERVGRPAKRQRRLITESDDSDDYTNATQANKARDSSHAAPSSSRPRRAAAAPTSATIERTSPEETRQSIHLTVKAAPSKLREATSGTAAPRKTAGVKSRDSFEDSEIVVGRRSSRRKTIVEDSSDPSDHGTTRDLVGKRYGSNGTDYEWDDFMTDHGEEDPIPMDWTEDDEDEETGEDEGADADGDEDVDMEDSLPAPPPPAIEARGGARVSKPSINITPAEPEIPSVEAKEMAMEDDHSEDEELSELDSQADDEDDEVGDDDAEVEDDIVDEELDSAEETPISGSRSATPDLSKLTRRQRAAYETYEGELIALSNEAQKKKHLTAEEHAMRRAEMARRRKNLSEKRNEEEKMDTINRLLKKQAPKRRGRAQIEADAAGEDQELDVERAPPLYVRYIQNREGSTIAVPDEWLVAPVGKMLSQSLRTTVKRPFTGLMVEEVA